MVTRAKDKATERQYTITEFEKMPESHERWELLDGKLVEKPLVKIPHAVIKDNLRVALYLFDPIKKLGYMASDVNVFICDNYSPAPDLSFWIASRRPEVSNATPAYPDLAVEVQSPGQSLVSLQKKSRDYIEAGVSLVWLVQPEKKRVFVYRSGQEQPETLNENDVLSGENVIPDFTMPVAALFVP